MTMRKNIMPGLLLAVSITLLCNGFFCPVGRAALRGGCAKVNITPPLGITLIGSKGQPSDAVMDDLYAKAMVLSDGVNTVAIVAADLLYTPLDDVTNPVRAAISEKTGILGRNVMVCATHTHSGPEVFTRTKVPQEGRLPAAQVDQSYVQVLIRKMADSVQIAHSNMQDVTLGAATGDLPEVLYNRRPVMKDGRVKMAFTLPPEVAATRRIERTNEGDTRVTFAFPPEEEQPTFGPIDPEVLALQMEDAEGRTVGSIIGFGCHPVCIYPYLSTTVSADYPAFATRVVEQVEGGTSLFVLGLAGNTVPLQRGPGPCEDIGKALGGEALRRLQLLATADDVTLKALSRKISLPIRRNASSDDPNNAESPDRIATEIQVLKLGDLCVLGLPGEVLVEVGLAIKQEADVENLFIVTLANDAVGYVCHAEAYERGGYEPGSGTNLAPGAGEIIIEQALALLDEIGQPPNGNAKIK